jgi:integral membrane sensor domain MASE1
MIHKMPSLLGLWARGRGYLEARQGFIQLKYWLWPPTADTIQLWPWFRKVSVIALSSMVFGILGHIFTALPGNVSAIWIPDAIGLAAIFLWGWSVAWGIFVGSVLNMIFFAPPTLPYLFTLVITGIGDVVFTIISVTLIQHFTKTRFPFDRAINVLYFIIFGIGFHQVADATIGVPLYVIADFIPWSEAKTAWFTWSFPAVPETRLSPPYY